MYRSKYSVQKEVGKKEITDNRNTLGEKVRIFLKTKESICRSCKGSGKQVCGNCGGSGTISSIDFHDRFGDDFEGFHNEQKYEVCNKCFGIGKVVCVRCQGKGVINGK